MRVVLSVGPNHDPAELAAVPAIARVERTVSHAAVLRQGASWSALLVSHAGHGSVVQPCGTAAPMVLVRWGRDQPGVAARAAALGVAEVVPREDASGETLRAAVDRALGSETMRAAAAQHAARLQSTDPQVVAATRLETLL